MDDWNRRTAQRHDDYRTRIEPVSGDISIVCVSNRPEFVGNVVGSNRMVLLK